MSKKLLVVLVFLLESYSESEAIVEFEKCIEELGCFGYMGAFYDPIHRPFTILPNDRNKINTTFQLYTRKNPKESQPLYNTPEFDFNQTNYNSWDETKVIVHGFRENEEGWMLELRDAYLAKDDVNIITVDWSQGATSPYILAATNTRVVGAELALLIERLVKETGARLDFFHLIGFSLGAHTCGYAGQRLKGEIRRISALDPAGPMFNKMPPVVRLDRTDAKFVDAIHTDAKSLYELSFGSPQEVGHVDFYPNGGHDQPGCPESIPGKVAVPTISVIVSGLDQAGEDVSCRHSRATKIFVDSVDGFGCMPISYPCPSYSEFLKGKCASCGKNAVACGVMGDPAAQYAPINSMVQGVRLYAKTTEKKPFCLLHYQITLTTSPDASKRPFGINFVLKTVSYGSLTAILEGEFGQSIRVELTDGAQELDPGTPYTFLATSSINLGDLKSISLIYTPSPAYKNIATFKFSVKEFISVKSVAVTNMHKLFKRRQTEEKTNFCSTEETVKPNQEVKFTPKDQC